MGGTRVLVCGGRDFFDAPRLEKALDGLASFAGPLTVIEGGARGADALAREWASRTGAECVTVPANWARYGNRAGPIRNTEMLVLHKPDLVIAAPGGHGTADMVRKAKSAGLPVYDLEFRQC